LWKAQNAFYEMWQKVYPEFRARADREAQVWASHFAALGEKLSVRAAP
jgi:hypothetical protein